MGKHESNMEKSDDTLFSLALPKRWSLLKSGWKIGVHAGKSPLSPNGHVSISRSNSRSKISRSKISRSISRSSSRGKKEAFGRRARSNKQYISNQPKEDNIGTLRVIIKMELMHDCQVITTVHIYIYVLYIYIILYIFVFNYHAH